MNNTSLLPPTPPPSDLGMFLQAIENLRADVREDIASLREEMHTDIQENTTETHQIRESVGDVRETVKGLAATVDILQGHYNTDSRIDKEEGLWQRTVDHANKYAWVAWIPALYYLLQMLGFIPHHGW